ncbi:uncharacterized protein [Phyllobates terribilis]|uniref:uncharacterized protein n=1 Tax=Phyllobates terribilis TaxID=111132 RepID=UPI003CCAE861
MLRNAVETNLNLLTKFIAVCSSIPTKSLDSFHGINYARRVFDQSPHKSDTFLSNIMIKCCCDHAQFGDAVQLYTTLRRNTPFVPDKYTFMSLVRCCNSNLLVCEGKQVHDLVLKLGLCLDMFLGTTIVDMYAKFGDMRSASMMFDELPDRSQVSWTVLVCGYAKAGDVKNASKYFDDMPEKDTPSINVMIDMYVKAGDIDTARRLFDSMEERNVISWTTLISGYCNNNDVESARLLFDSMPQKNLVSWNAMISGYSRNKQPQEALNLFNELQSNNLFEPDAFTILSIIPAIADLGASDLGCWVYQYVQKTNLYKSTKVCTALIGMFAKCGEISRAVRIFEGIKEKETATWNTVINGLAVNGMAMEALQFFEEMRDSGFKPDEITMVGVLSACNHGGLVEEGKKWFKAMTEFAIDPQIEHYGCMIDLLGRAGHLDEAESLLSSMPYDPNGIILSSFLSSCGYRKDVNRAERILEKAVQIEPKGDGNYIMLRNIYAMERRWEDADVVKGMMRKSGAKKETGCSAIEVDSRVLEFVSGDKMHPQWNVIHSVLSNLFIQMSRQEKEFMKLE